MASHQIHPPWIRLCPVCQGFVRFSLLDVSTADSYNVTHWFAFHDWNNSSGNKERGPPRKMKMPNFCPKQWIFFTVTSMSSNNSTIRVRPKGSLYNLSVGLFRDVLVPKPFAALRWAKREDCSDSK